MYGETCTCVPGWIVHVDVESSLSRNIATSAWFENFCSETYATNFVHFVGVDERQCAGPLGRFRFLSTGGT